MQRDIDLAVVDVDEFLGSLSISYKIEGGKRGPEARFSCPYSAHQYGDKTPSAYMNFDSTAFVCHSCGETGNAITVLADVMQVSRTTARQWIAERWAPHFAQIDDLRSYVQGMWERGAQGDVLPADVVVLDEGEFESRRVDWAALDDDFSSAPGWARYMLGRRDFEPDVLARFDVCYDEQVDRPCVTVRSPTGDLIGFKGRAWRPEQWPKYMVVGDTDRTIAERGEVFGFRPYEASRHVFGLGIARARDGRLVVCEGELNVIAMHQRRLDHTVGPSGSTITEEQVEQIAERCDEAVLLFDSDATDPIKAATAQLKIYKAIAMFEPHVAVSVCPVHQDDPADIGEAEARHLVEAAVSATTYKVRSLLG